MIALDTNVIIRFLVRDDEKQSKIVYTRLKKAETDRERLFIPLVVLLETLWVLESAYDMSRCDILDALEDLRQMPIFDFEADRVLDLLLASGRKTTADLSDLLIAHSAECSGCDSVLTFDKKASRQPLFQLMK